MNWISVKERLPNNTDYILVYIGDAEYVDFAYYVDGDFWCDDMYKCKGITHWCSLDDIPKPESD